MCILDCGNLGYFLSANYFWLQIFKSLQMCSKLWKPGRLFSLGISFNLNSATPDKCFLWIPATWDFFLSGYAFWNLNPQICKSTNPDKCVFWIVETWDTFYLQIIFACKSSNLWKYAPNYGNPGDYFLWVLFLIWIPKIWTNVCSRFWKPRRFFWPFLWNLNLQIQTNVCSKLGKPGIVFIWELFLNCNP